MAIVLTETAARRVKIMLEKHGTGVGLRLGARKSGCSGYAYVVDYADRLEVGDTVFESRGVRVVVDSQSLPLLDGVEVDYVHHGPLSEGFEFHNPNATEQCGCGESFGV